MCAPKTYWAPRADRTSMRFLSLGEKKVSFYVSWLVGLGKAVPSPPRSLLLGTEASCSCPALLPLTWNVNKPAAETKHN